MEDFITTGYNYLLFQLKQEQIQKQASMGNFSGLSTVQGSGATAIGGTEIMGIRSITESLQESSAAAESTNPEFAGGG